MGGMTTALGANRIHDDPKVYACLIDGFTKGYTDAEACLGAGIGKNILYRYIEQFPEFQGYKEELKQSPVLIAKSRVVSVLHEDTGTAKWYLERRTKEFRPPDKSTNIQFNQLNSYTVLQLKDKLALELNKLLCNTNCNTDDNVTDVEVTDEPVDVSDAEVISDDST